MKIRHISGTGSFIIYVALILTVLVYFMTPLWWLILRQIVGSISSPQSAAEVFRFVWGAWLGLPFLCFIAGIYWMRRTRDEATFCMLIGYLIPTAIYCAYGAYLLLNMSFLL